MAAFSAIVPGGVRHPQLILSFKAGLHRRRTKDFERLLGMTTRKSWSKTTQVVLGNNAQSYKETERVR